MVSVVMPAFNAARTLQIALNSILHQSLRNIEIIVGDDASTDETGAIALATKDPRIKLIRNDRRVGPGPTKDRLLRAIQGRWIAFIDADDAWEPDRLELLVAAAGDDPDALVFDDLERCHEAGIQLIPWRRLRGERAFGGANGVVTVAPAALVSSSSMLMQPLVSAALLRSSQASHGDSPYGEDTRFLLGLLAAGARLVYVPRALYLYRVGHVSATANIDRYALLLGILRDGLGLFAGDPAMHGALERKIRRVERQEARLRFGRHLKRAEMLAALAVVRARPSLFVELLRHNAVMLGLRAHKLASRLGVARARGRGRGTNGPPGIIHK